MYYTMVELNEVMGNLQLTLDKDGNKYSVGLYNKETKEYTHQEFVHINEAWPVYSVLAEMITKSLYTEKQKREFLASPIKRPE